ncbi:dihydrofolate reductase [Carnobacterium iners]|uniref:Dihydrofolate reductase n=1 Tax=Carnobacterium iners TaxID=1073423 RepID=A0A1X7NDU7_9LACT|nr:dihydrofolate reductase [Carnobacterium iners]SEK37402.1 dihydrofolate reductase [Carnobacterium iners]SMH35811.1 dihydrofolate reductase [Carnobacterium iners]
MIAFLWAQDENGLIGNQGTLPWSLPNDLKYFKKMTQEKAVVMGRKTFEGMNKRPLPNRVNIILTTDENYQADGVMVMHSVNEVMTFAKQYENDTFITGGTAVFEAFLPFADSLYRTVIHAEFEGDTTIPVIDWDKWKLTDSQVGLMDDRNKYPHDFETFNKK